MFKALIECSGCDKCIKIPMGDHPALQLISTAEARGWELTGNKALCPDCAAFDLVAFGLPVEPLDGLSPCNTTEAHLGVTGAHLVAGREHEEWQVP